MITYIGRSTKRASDGDGHTPNTGLALIDPGAAQAASTSLAWGGGDPVRNVALPPDRQRACERTTSGFVIDRRHRDARRGRSCLEAGERRASG